MHAGRGPHQERVGHADQLVVQAIVQIARGLGKQTIAEFVEDGGVLTGGRRLVAPYVITVIGVLAAPVIVPILAWEFPPEKAALAVTLAQIMFPFILLVALAALAMGVLNTKGKFGIPASASTAFNIASIIFGLGFAYWLSGGNWEISGDKTAIASDASLP